MVESAPCAPCGLLVAEEEDALVGKPRSKVLAAMEKRGSHGEEGEGGIRGGGGHHLRDGH